MRFGRIPQLPYRSSAFQELENEAGRVEPSVPITTSSVETLASAAFTSTTVRRRKAEMVLLYTAEALARSDTEVPGSTGGYSSRCLYPAVSINTHIWFITARAYIGSMF